MARSCRVTILISSLQRLPIAIPGPLRAREQRAVHLCRNKLSGRGMVLESPAFTRSCSDSFPHHSSRTSFKISPENQYQRLLVHRCAQYYRMSPENDPATRDKAGARDMVVVITTETKV